MNFASTTWRTLQSRLLDLNYYHLKIDGHPGIGTQNAVIAFKQHNGLRARAYIGPKTATLLWSDKAKALKATTVADTEGDNIGKLAAYAKKYHGLKEYPGKKNNPIIMKMANDLDQWYPGDDVAWCGLFVAHCAASMHPDEPQDFNRLGARDWLKWGKESEPCINTVCVNWRTSRSHWHGHVYLPLAQSQDGDYIYGIGGNQNDSVSMRWFPRSKALGFRIAQGEDRVMLPKISASGIRVGGRED